MFSVQTIVEGIAEILKAKNILHAVLSPGSRNAPVIIQFTSDPSFTTYSIVDERSAGFFALGIAQQLQEPVVLNCTSGSALANYYPALLEAYYQDIPLILLTADKPIELIGIRDGQTIQQENIYGGYVVKFVQLSQDFSEKGLWYNNYLVNEALNAALYLKKPVHLNLPLSEPLYNSRTKINHHPKIITTPSLKFFLKNTSSLKSYLKIWKKNTKKMILIGQQNPSSELVKILKKLIRNHDSLVVLTETLSNIYGSYFIEYNDSLLYSMNKKEVFYPDLLITLGKSLVSKKIKIFLRNATPKHHWHIERNSFPTPDTYYALTTYWNLTPETFLKKLSTVHITSHTTSDFQKKWHILSEKCAKKHSIFLSKTKFCDLKVFQIALETIPKGSVLHLGNSMSIRYQQLFKRKKNVTFYANRGTAGIDGSVSTAIGAAVVSQNPVVLIIGDLSFFYESNALWNSYIPNSFRLILINNGGGDIFRFIPGPSQTSNFEEYFVKNHKLNAQSLCEMYHWKYLYADEEFDLKKKLKKFWKPIKDDFQANLLEINTVKSNNANELRKYFLSFNEKNTKSDTL